MTQRGDRVRAMRMRLGLAQSDLAALLAITVDTVSRWERNRIRVGNSEFAVICALAEEREIGRSDMLIRLRTLDCEA